MQKIPKYTGPKTIRMIEDTEGNLIKIQIPEGLVESGIKPEDVEVEHYVRIPLEEEDYQQIKALADKAGLTVDQLASHTVKAFMERLEKKQS